MKKLIYIILFSLFSLNFVSAQHFIDVKVANWTQTNTPPYVDKSPISNVNVSIYNSLGDLVYNGLTNSSGDIERQYLNESSYLITAKKSLTTFRNISVNLTKDVKVLINPMNCGYRDLFFKCQDADTNKDFIVNNLDALQDYNLDDIINLSDQNILDTFNNCSWDKNVYFYYANAVNISKKINLDELYQTYLNMGTTYGIQRLRHLYPNGTCATGVYEYSWNYSSLVNKRSNCSYDLMGTIWINNNGELDLNSCSLYMNSSIQGQYKLEVYNNGTLSIINSTLSSSSYDNFEFNAYPNSNIFIDNSYISNYDSLGSFGIPYASGFTIATNKAIIKNTLFNNTYIGLTIINSKPDIRNVRINAFDNAIYLKNTSGIVLRNVSMGGLWGHLYPAYGIVIYNTNLTFVSGDYNGFYRQIQCYGKCNLNRAWFVNVKVLDINYNPIPKATVSFYNNSDSLTNFAWTKPSGDIRTQEVIEYISNGTTKFNQNNYTINVSSLNYQNNSISVNVTNDTNLSIFMKPIFQTCPRRLRCPEIMMLTKGET